jgi:hypothetical protein
MYRHIGSTDPGHHIRWLDFERANINDCAVDGVLRRYSPDTLPASIHHSGLR